MKKIVLSLLFAVLVFAGITVAAESIDDTGTWAYETYGSGVVLTDYKGTASDVYVPNTIEAGGTSLSVVKLGDNLFNGDTINSATLGEGITIIGEGAFANNTNIVCIVTPESLTTIGKNAFSGCKNFNSIILYDTVTSIGENAFVGCADVEIYGADGSYAQEYAANNSLNFIIISESATPETITQNGITYYIQNGEAKAISFDNSIADVVVPMSVNGYPVTDVKTAFRGSDITSIELPSGITAIIDDAFSNCERLANISMPESIRAIGVKAFDGCKKLVAIEIPDGVTVINPSAFASCKSLSSVTISESVTTIETNSFGGCSNLSMVKVSSNVSKMYTTSFPSTTVICVKKDSYAHTFCVNNNLRHYVMTEEEFPPTYVNNGVTYAIINNEAIATAFNNLVANVTIPETVEGYTVTDIGTVFKNSDIVSVALPKSVTCIEPAAFANCSSLTNVNLPTSIKEIPQEAFYRCYSLSNIDISDSITSIGEFAFFNCTNLKTINIPSSVVSIDSSAFFNCTNIESVYITNLAKWCSISFGGHSNPLCYGADLYLNNQKVVTLNIPSGIDIIGDYAFSGCLSLESIVIPNGVTSIGKHSFDNCRKLNNISISNTVKTIGNYAFSGCLSLESIAIPEGVTSIGEHSFDNCRKLNNISISNTVTTIGDYAFANCYNLAQAELPSSVTTIEMNSFPDTTILFVEEFSDAFWFAYTIRNNLRCRLTTDSATEMQKIDGVTYAIIDGLAMAVAYDNSVSEIIIPETISGCSVVDMGTVFKGSDIVSLTVPESLWSLASYSFYDCDKLETVTIPSNRTSIKDHAFSNSGITNITIPEGTTSIADSMFYDCSRLVSVTIPETVTKIGNFAFINCVSLSEINLPKSVTFIGYCAFQNCKTLKKVSFPGVTEIGPQSFEGCKSLESIIIPESASTIGYSAFAGCSSLSNIKIYDGVTTMEWGIFAGCTNIRSIYIPNSVTTLDWWMFSGCVNLTNINIPNTVKELPSNMFGDCTSLETIIIPDSVTTIVSNAFSNCTNLRTVTIPASVTSMAADSFPANTILCVYENSYAHTFAEENDLLYFVIRHTINPEISYGQGLSGTVTDSNGAAISGASATLTDDSGVVRETVTTDETGAYEFTYAEVGRYTIRATDSSGAVGTETVAVKKMNVFEVYLTGETDIVIDSANTVSGTVSENNATITITDEEGNVIASTETTNGTFEFDNITNGTYIIKAETQTGSAAQEITVFNGDVTDITLTIVAESSGLSGTVKDEDGNPRIWADVTVYNSDGIAVASGKTNENGVYTFSGLANDEYAIVAESNEIKKHHKKDYDRSVTLKGYGFIEITAVGTYTVDIVVSDENEDTSKVSIEGKVTAEGERNKSTVVLYDVFRNEVAKTETGSNGKYKFVNVKDGLYFITATTESDGMGITVVVVRGGKVYGPTDIRVYKSDKIKNREEYAKNNIPECNNREDAIKHKDKIREEKDWYDKLSKKEKQQLSKEYIDRLEQYIEWISQTEYKTDENVKVEGGGSISSGEEIANGDNIQIEITIEKTAGTEIGDDGVKTHDEYERQTIEDNAKEREIKQYYNISMRKGINGAYHEVDNIHKDTGTTGKLRITMPIPEECKGYKHYTFVHMHNGEAVTLVDLDNDPDTITFEVDKFSTFVLCASNEEVAEYVTYPASMTYDETTGKISVASSEAGTLYIATYNGEKVTDVISYGVEAGVTESYDFSSNQKAYVWNSLYQPLCEKFEITK